MWMMGRAHVLPDLAAPRFDLGALESEVQVAKAHARRKPISLAVRTRLAVVFVPYWDYGALCV